MIQKSLLFLFTLVLVLPLGAQNYYWQQQADYSMQVDFDVEKNQYSGKQSLIYTNNSPDSLKRVFFHLYPNAFQPGSMMDVRSRTIADPDRRVGDRISTLSEDEMGYLKVVNLKCNGKELKTKESETILQVLLDKAIAPGEKATFTLDFEGQVPKQIRRSGRDNSEGIRLSMSQWYPKMCEYDREGWHANPYLGREFHGVWGSFDVKISIAADYVMAATGELMNGNEIGFGYEKPGTKVKAKSKGKQEWHWKADQVHDFVWAADPDYKHVVRTMSDGPTIHFLYQEGEDTEAWQYLPEYVEKAFREMNRRFGVYPYKNFYVIQGGDGGMEYPMATLITGHRGIESLVGVTIHEMFHSWYQGVLATDELMYPWMDEGFTSYTEAEVFAKIFDGNDVVEAHSGAYLSYFALVRSDMQEPMTTHGDHYKTNRAYGTNAYSKGELTLVQLAYIVGQETFEMGMRNYFNEWKFKHPRPSDFKLCMEKVSGMELDWYFEYWVNTTETIDYEISQVTESNEKTFVEIRKIGMMPMPLEIEVILTNGQKHLYYIPLSIMYGSKSAFEKGLHLHEESPWPWTHPSYVIEMPFLKKNISSIEIDPKRLMADINFENNTFFEKKLYPGAGM